ncbi:tether containing UBX domain for GLUT4 [Megalops cyprinoides]|uniref:tether containing UBX domain for GLUT4 n=1 Tax=Megalops cyprinoides TaxID=118141 RepID=UPI0018649D60|nr:tether containing UBX domain for GLUT4 [Megalops cyprinoides]
MAASSTTVTVLAPNGRRQTVKISSSTPLLQVLEDVCKKHGFNPDEYDLKFQRTVLDLSQQWRFASLPNNAKLEMAPTSRQRTGAESRVRIALQLEDGSRLQDSFSSGQTLWELVNHFPQTRLQEQQLSDFTPVCVYMRDEVSGAETLKQTTLKSLGLTGGSAIVRYVLKATGSPEDGDSMETAAVAVEKSEEPQPGVSPPASDWMGPDGPPATAPPPQSTVAQTPPVREEADGTPQPPQTVRPKTRPKNQESDEQPGPSGGCPALPPPPSASQPCSFVPFSGGGQRLGGDGGHGAPPSFSTVPAGPPKAKKPKPSNEAKRTASAKNGESSTQPEEFLEPVDREPLVYHLDAGVRRPSYSDDLPDEFFEVTIDDIRKRFAQLKSERKLLEEAPLMTKALREARMKEKLERYPKVVVRVQFPDRHVLQGFFRPLETVAALKRFVRNHLADPELRFYLFLAPPKTILEDSTATLFQANLFPAALVYFGSDVKTDVFLQRQLLDSSVSALEADEAIAGCMPRSPTPSSTSLVSEEPFPPPAGSDAPASEPSAAADLPPPHANSQAPKAVRTDPSKLPAWLKLPGKK